MRMCSPKVIHIADLSVIYVRSVFVLLRSADEHSQEGGGPWPRKHLIQLQLFLCRQHLRCTEIIRRMATDVPSKCPCPTALLFPVGSAVLFGIREEQSQS